MLSQASHHCPASLWLPPLPLSMESPAWISVITSIWTSCSCSWGSHSTEKYYYDPQIDPSWEVHMTLLRVKMKGLEWATGLPFSTTLPHGLLLSPSLIAAPNILSLCCSWSISLSLKDCLHSSFCLERFPSDACLCLYLYCISISMSLWYCDVCIFGLPLASDTELLKLLEFPKWWDP